MSSLFPENAIIKNGKLYALVNDTHSSCEFCDLAAECWQYWQGCNIQPCSCFGKDSTVFKLMPICIKREDKFTFGKFKGKFVSDVIESDPHYVKWASDNVEWFNLDSDLKDKLAKALKKVSKKRNSYMPFENCSEDGEIAGQDAFGSIF